MDRDHKIEKINAYRRLLETRKLPKISALEDAEAHHLVAKELHDEFESWVEGQISVLLGEGSASNATHSLPFDNEELEILKTLVAGVKARRNAAPTEEVKVRPAPVNQPSEGAIIKKTNSAIRAQENPLSDAERARLNSTAKPLGNRKMGDSSRASGNDPLVSMLDKMEDEGPTF